MNQASVLHAEVTCCCLLLPAGIRWRPFFLLHLSLTFINFAIADRFAEARLVGHVGGRQT